MRIFLIFIFLCQNAFAGSSSLTFGGATSNRVLQGSGSSIDNLNPVTWMLRIFPTVFTADRMILDKATSGESGHRVRISGTAGALQVVFDRATTDTLFVTNSILRSNFWQDLVVVFDSNEETNEAVQVYYKYSTGSFLTEATYTTTTNGSGAMQSDAANNLIIGNSGGLTSSFQGQIEWVGIWNRKVKDLSEAVEQFRVVTASGNVLDVHYGMHGSSAAGVQEDWSGNANKGGVIGPVGSLNGPPISILGGPY